MSKYLLLTDYKPPVDWEFARGFTSGCGEIPDIHYCVTNWPRTNIWRKVKRYLLYFLFPLRQVRFNGKYDVIIGYQQFYALNMVFFMSLFGMQKKSRFFAMTFIFKKKRGLAGTIYKRYMKRIVNSCYLDRLFVYSKEEASYYADLFGCDSSKFVYVPLAIGELPALDIRKGDYCFSAGRSNRDYAFLCSAFSHLPYHLIIATDLAVRDIPGNVEVLRDCFGDDMLSCMSGAFCVIIPLEDQQVSSGQLVALQAMQMGKPVIITRSSGIADYIEDGVTGLLMDNTEESLARDLLKLSDTAEYDRIAQNAARFVRENCSVFGRGRLIGEHAAGTGVLLNDLS